MNGGHPAVVCVKAVQIDGLLVQNVVILPLKLLPHLHSQVPNIQEESKIEDNEEYKLGPGRDFQHVQKRSQVTEAELGAEMALHPELE